MNAPSNRLADGPAQAAVMVMLIGEEDAARILSGLSPEELRLLGSRMCGLGEIGPRAIADAVAGFARSAHADGILANNRVEDVRRIMSSAIGDIKADSLMRRIAPSADQLARPALELARWLDPVALLPLLQDEHPQAIAVILVQLDPDIAASVLSGLPEALQASVVQRIGRLGPVSTEAVELLEEMLSARIAETHGRLPLTMGGVREAADIINNTARQVSKRVMPGVAKLDKQLASQIEDELVKFDDLFALDAQMMGQLLREVESEVLVDALKGLTEEERAPFFAAMSSRAVDGLRDEIEGRGRIKRSDVDTAQRAILAVAKQLAADGAIVLGQGSDDEFV